MLKETLLAMRITEKKFFPDICRLLKSAEKDLKIAGVIIDGECSFDITESEDPVTGKTIIDVTDNSTITDEMIMTAMITYCRKEFGSPPDYDRMAASYDLQRKQLANATGYTDFGEETAPAEEEGP